MDPITLGLLAVGGVFLVLWRQSQKSYNNREQHRITKGLVDMDNDSSGPRQPPRATPNLPADLMRDLPRQVDEAWVEGRVMENIADFRKTDKLLEKFLLNLRDHYRSKWELQMLDRVEQKLRKEISVMEAGVTYTATQGTLRERAETEIWQAKTQHETARQEYERVTARSAESVRIAELEAENARLRVENENRDLKQKLAGEPDRPTGPAAAAPDPVSRAKATVARIKELEEEMARELEGLDPKSERATYIKKVYQNLIRSLMEGD